MLVEAPVDVMLKFVEALDTPTRSVWYAKRTESLVEESLGVASKLGSLTRRKQNMGDAEVGAESALTLEAAPVAQAPTRFSVSRIDDRTSFSSALKKNESGRTIRILFYLSPPADTLVLEATDSAEPAANSQPKSQP